MNLEKEGDKRRDWWMGEGIFILQGPREGR
jgi:hypothetical protein